MFRHGWEGIGFVFTKEDPFAGVDLDHCRASNGSLQPWALDIVQHLDSYTEWSPSGEGLHVLIRASLPGSGGRRRHGIEVYSSARYFTITGGHYEQAPQTIEWRQQEAVDLLAKLESGDRDHRCVRLPSEGIAATDEELLRRAGHAANGWKFKKLWAGDTSDYDCDHSRADAALCSFLAYYTDGDHARIDQLFRVSGLYRQKWDRPTAGSTYGAITIEASMRNAFCPDHENEEAPIDVI